MKNRLARNDVINELGSAANQARQMTVQSASVTADNLNLARIWTTCNHLLYT